MDAPPGYVEPTFGQRLLARLVDGLVLLPSVLIVGVAVDGRLGVATRLVVAAAYEIGLIARDGQTLGKRALGIRVVAVDGSPPTLRQAALRWSVPFSASAAGAIVPALGGLSGFVAVLVYLPILQPPLHRGIHDRVAGTIVTAG